MTIGEALALGPGSVVSVGRLAGDPVDLLVNGRVIARGEVVAIDEELGLRITEIAAAVVGPAPEIAAEAPDPGPQEIPQPDAGRRNRLKRPRRRAITGGDPEWIAHE